MKASAWPLSSLHDVEKDLLAVFAAVSGVEVVRLVNQQHPTRGLFVHLLGCGTAGEISKLALDAGGDCEVTLDEV